VNSLKTMFLAVLMSAATYGVYVTITGNPPAPPPKDAKGWAEDPPQVEIPAGERATASSPPAPTSVPPEPPPAAADRPASPYEAGAANTNDPRGGTPDAAHHATADVASGPAPHQPPDVSDVRDHAASAPAAPAGGPSDDRYPPDSVEDRYPPNDRYPSYPAADAAGESRRDGGPPHPTPTDGSPPPDPTEVHNEFVAGMRVAEGMLADHHLVDALLELSRMVGDPLLAADDEAQLTELLDQLAGTVVYSREHLLEPPYEVQPGDTLDRVAEAYHVPWQLLANINGITDARRQLQPGDTLKVIKGPFEAVVDLGRFRLTLFVGGCYAGRFEIGIGQDCTTPLGDFVVQKKVVNPDYYGEQVIAAGSPDNPLGEYALQLSDQIFIHGTNDPASIGRAESKGCIRLNNHDIADLFSILSEKTERTPGSPVSIRR